MAKSIPVLLILVVLATLGSSQQAGPAPQPVPSHTVPLQSFPRDHRFATISGDPTKSGALPDSDSLRDGIYHHASYPPGR